MNINDITADQLWCEVLCGRIVHFSNDIGVSRFNGKFYIFDLGGAEAILDVANTTPARLLAHVKGFVANRIGG